MNSKIQELESQLRTQRVDYEGQLRSKNTLIRELEEKIATLGTTTNVSILKAEDSRVTGTPFGGTSSSSNVDRMSSSVASSSSSISGSNLTSSQYGSTSQSGVKYTSSSYQPAQYGTSGITSYGVTSSVESTGSPVTSTYATGMTGSTYGATGTTYGGLQGSQTSNTGSNAGYQSYFSKYARGGN